MCRLSVHNMTTEYAIWRLLQHLLNCILQVVRCSYTVNVNTHTSTVVHTCSQSEFLYSWGYMPTEFQGLWCFSVLEMADGNLLTRKMTNFVIFGLTVGAATSHIIPPKFGRFRCYGSRVSPQKLCWTTLCSSGATPLPHTYYTPTTHLLRMWLYMPSEFHNLCFCVLGTADQESMGEKKHKERKLKQAVLSYASGRQYWRS